MTVAHQYSTLKGWNIKIYYKIFFPSVLWRCWLGDRKGIWPVKKQVLICWWWWFDWSFARLIAPVVTTTSIILSFNKHQLTQVHLDNGKWPLKRRVSVKIRSFALQSSLTLTHKLCCMILKVKMNAITDHDLQLMSLNVTKLRSAKCTQTHVHTG